MSYYALRGLAYDPASLVLDKETLARQKFEEAYVKLYEVVDRMQAGRIPVNMQNDIRYYETRWQGISGPFSEKWSAAQIDRLLFDVDSMRVLTHQLNKLADQTDAADTGMVYGPMPPPPGGSVDTGMVYGPMPLPPGGPIDTGRVFGPTGPPVIVSPNTKIEIQNKGMIPAVTTPAPGKKAAKLDWKQLLALVESGMKGYANSQKQAAAAQLMALQQRGQSLYLDKPTKEAVEKYKDNTLLYVGLGALVVGGLALYAMKD